MNRVFILGAGFSKAINPVMPVLGELTKGVEDVLRAQNIEIGNDLGAIGDAERWLSSLAEPAPWLSPAEQLRNTALFTDVSQAIHEIINANQQTAVTAEAPDWLLALVRYWHNTDANVITFNYDCLVELAYLDAMTSAGVYWPWDLYTIPITPAWARVGGGARQKLESFQLLKLHGSLDWWYSGPDAESSDPIYWMGWTGHFQETMRPLWGEFGGERIVMDKLPMLVPPAATKGPYYKNRLLAAQWADAAAALRDADELVIMGYSAPATDLTVTTLITTQFKGNTIVPVNRDRGLIKRAAELGDRRNPPRVVKDFIDPKANVMQRWTGAFAS